MSRKRLNFRRKNLKGSILGEVVKFDEISCLSAKFAQHVIANRIGVSSVGTKYDRGDPIFRFSSLRNTGEIYVMTRVDLEKLMNSKPSKWFTAEELYTKAVTAAT